MSSLDKMAGICQLSYLTGLPFQTFYHIVILNIMVLSTQNDDVTSSKSDIVEWQEKAFNLGRKEAMCHKVSDQYIPLTIVCRNGNLWSMNIAKGKSKPALLKVA